MRENLFQFSYCKARIALHNNAFVGCWKTGNFKSAGFWFIGKDCKIRVEI